MMSFCVSGRPPLATNDGGPTAASQVDIKVVQAAQYELAEATKAVKNSVRLLRARVAREGPVLVTTSASSTGSDMGSLGYHSVIVDEPAPSSIPAAASAAVRASGGAGRESAEITRCFGFMCDLAQLPPSCGVRYSGNLVPMGNRVLARLQPDHTLLTLNEQ